MVNRRNFLKSTTAFAALAASAWGTSAPAHAWRRPHPRAHKPAPPFRVDATPKFATHIVNPLDPTFPGLRRPPNKWAATLSIRETSLKLGLTFPNGAPVSTRVWGYDLDKLKSPIVPGPTIEVNSGSQLTVTYVNALDGVPNRMPVDTTIDWANPGSVGGLMPVPLVTHLHGAKSEFRSDGVPDAWYTPGYKQVGTSTQADFTSVYHTKLFNMPYTYENKQEAGHLWYHDHVLGITRLNVNMGLAGFYFIRDANEDKLRGTNVLPSWPYEVPLMMMDRSFDANGQLFYPSTSSDPGYAGLPLTHLPEFFGDVMLVNGGAWPKMRVEKRKYRFRMLNASDSRFLALKIQPELTSATGPSSPNPAVARLPIMVIGNELGLLDYPAYANWASPGISQDNTLLIGPGERYDVIIDFSAVKAGTRLVLWNDASAPYNGQPADGIDYIAPVPGLTDRVMAFDVVPQNPLVPDAKVAGPTNTSPGTFLRPLLGPLPTIASQTVAGTRQLLLVEGTDFFGRLQTMIGTLKDGTFTYRDPITEFPKVNTTEIWEFYNSTGDAHPIHMHLVDFRVLNREDFTANVLPKPMVDKSTGGVVDSSGVTLAGNVVNAPAHEAGRKDTVVCYPNQVTRVQVNFSRAGDYVYHCHILSHEDHEMMRPYRVVS